VSGISVTALATTPVKGMRLRARDTIELGEMGARGDRAFYLIDERGSMVNAKRIGGLHAIVPSYDPAAQTFALNFPDGTEVAGTIEYGDALQTRFLSESRAARELRGPWSDALSTYFDRPLRLVAPETGADRGRAGATSIISRSSLRRLAEVAQSEDVDARRFRMLIEIDGVGAHEEDGWVGRTVQVGAATLRMLGHVGRCMVTSRDPDTGKVTLPTLDLLGTYRRELDSTEPLPFGIYGEVLQGGTVRVGDSVELADE
jgi:MOSC domain-containing protein